MLDKYCNSQKIAFSLLSNSIDNNSVSHAYLFDLNSYSLGMDFVMSFVKTLFCKNLDLELSSLEASFVCKRIDEGNCLEVKVIEPDGVWIKKEQMLDLQKYFSMSSIEGKLRIYIIKDADKMNGQAANCMLKFLEEPCDNLVAILVTNNMQKMLSTIVSRCQLITLNNVNDKVCDSAIENFGVLKNVVDLSEFIVDEDNINFVEAVVNFVQFYEKNKLDAIVYAKDIWFNIFDDRDKMLLAFDLCINFYNDCLLFKYGKEISFFKDYDSIVSFVCSINSDLDICRKLEVFINTKDYVRYNLNSNLLFDRMIIDLGGD